jgi:alkylation response protein AidB-like acyl-CoA dehydrogenase
MELALSDEQRMLQEMARNFARKEIDPVATAIDADEAIPPALIAKLAELGFFGLLIPTRYGGLGENLTTGCLVLEEIGKASPSIAGLLSVQMLLTACSSPWPWWLQVMHMRPGLNPGHRSVGTVRGRGPDA